MNSQGQNVTSGAESSVLLSLSAPELFAHPDETTSEIQPNPGADVPYDVSLNAPISLLRIPDISVDLTRDSLVKSKEKQNDTYLNSASESECLNESQYAHNDSKELPTKIDVNNYNDREIVNECEAKTFHDIEHFDKDITDLGEFLADDCIDSRHSKMGNQSGKSPQSDEDTPDETKTKCCEIPKKKIKDRNSKISRSSKTEENDFTEDEVYPFESRSRSDQDLNEPVELEPFEIIETDEIKFVAGAGTSEVIRIASEAKFKAIPEEDSFDVEHEEDIDQTEVKEPVSIDKGDHFPESGTTTAHSTFEFKQIKSRTKLKTPKPSIDQLKSTGYDNVLPCLDDIEERFSETTSVKSEATPRSSKIFIDAKPKTARPDSEGSFHSSKSGTCSSDQSDASKKSSKESSRKNSKEAIVKPARKSKGKKQSESDKVIVVFGDKLEETGENTITLPAHANKKDNVSGKRQTDNVIILTQTMFSKPKKPEKSEQTNVSIVSNVDDRTKYENVNLGVKFEPSVGISVSHKEPSKSVKLDSYENVGVCAKFDPNFGISIGHSEQKKTQSDAIKEENVFHAIQGASPHQMSLAERAEKVKEQFLEDERAVQESKKHAIPVFKLPPHVSSNRRTAGTSEVPTVPKNDDVGDDKIISASNDDLSEMVPPPSPTAMDTLLEEEEEFEEEDEDDDEDEVGDDVLDEEERRKSAEIVEFTEHVCKRLSQLLDVMTQSEDSSDIETAPNAANDENQSVHENTSTQQNQPELEKNTKHGYESSETVLAEESRLTRKSELKRKSQQFDELKKKENDRQYEVDYSSDDDLPEYFDPRPPPKRDSEILCEVLDAYSENITEVSAQDIALISHSHHLNFESPDFLNLQSTKSNKNDIAVRHETNYTYVESDDCDDFLFYEDSMKQSNCYNESNLNSSKPDSLIFVSPQACSYGSSPNTTKIEELFDTTPTSETLVEEYTALAQNVRTDEEEVPLQFDTYGRRSVTYTESDLDISEHRDDLSTDSMLADDEDEETVDILFTKTYTEPVKGSEVFLSCTVVNSAYKEQQPKPKSETWLSDEALEYLEANAADVMSTAFMKARKEMKDIQICIQSLRQQMEHFHGDRDDIRLPNIPADSLSPDYFGFSRKAVTD